MTFAIAITVGTLGVIAMAVGAGMYVLFRFAQDQFDNVVRAQFAEQRIAVASPRIWKIPNPLVRDIVKRHLAAAQDVLAVAVTRCALQSRQHQALAAATIGAGLTLVALFTNAWLPLIWAPA